eukprot:s2485_g1.t1
MCTARARSVPPLRIWTKLLKLEGLLGVKDVAKAEKRSKGGSSLRRPGSLCAPCAGVGIAGNWTARIALTPEVALLASARMSNMTRFTDALATALGDWSCPPAASSSVMARTLPDARSALYFLQSLCCVWFAAFLHGRRAFCVVPPFSFLGLIMPCRYFQPLGCFIQANLGSSCFTDASEPYKSSAERMD